MPKLRIVLCLGLFGIFASYAQAADDYDPLRSDEDFQAHTVDLTVSDAARDREIPLRIYFPRDANPAPLLLFSHGLGGTKETCAYLADHWSARGYVVVAMQHAGSDESVWKDVPPVQRFAALSRAASATNSLLRVQDVASVLDQLQSWNQQGQHDLQDRLDLAHIGMSGHSFGAQTTQVVSGMGIPMVRGRGVESRIKAAVVLSPSSPRGRDPLNAFRGVTIPWLVMTGTKDTSPIGSQTVESRRAVYAALPPGNKYELVLHNAEHSAFTERALPGDRVPRNSNHHRAIKALSTAFWDAYLRDNHSAKTWLDGAAANAVLQEKDVLQRK